MKFIDEIDFKMREGEGEVVYDSGLDKYGLLVNGVFFAFLTKDQAKLMDDTLANPEAEKFFNSIGIGPEFLNMQPKAACYTDYERPTGEIQFESVKKVLENRLVKIQFANDADAKEFIEKAKEEFDFPPTLSKFQVVHGRSKSGGSVFIEKGDKMKKKVKEGINYTPEQMGDAFNGAFYMTTADFNAWKNAITKYPYAKVVSDDNDLFVCYLNGQHIASYIASEERLMCDEASVQYFGHFVESKKTTKKRVKENKRVSFSASEGNSIEDSLNKMFQGSESVYMNFAPVEIKGPGAPIIYSAVVNEHSLIGSTVEGVKEHLDEYETNLATILKRNEKEFAMYEGANTNACLIVENSEGFKYLIDRIDEDFGGYNPEYYGDKIPNAFAHALTFEDWQFIRIDDGSFCEEDLLLSKEEFDTIFDSATKMYIQLQVQFEERSQRNPYEGMYESKKIKEADISKVKKFSSSYFDKLSTKARNCKWEFEEETPEYDSYAAAVDIFWFASNYINSNHEACRNGKGKWNVTSFYQILEEPVEHFGMNANNGAEGFSEEFFQACYEEGTLPFIRKYITEEDILEALDYIESNMLPELKNERNQKKVAKYKATDCSSNLESSGIEDDGEIGPDSDLMSFIYDEVHSKFSEYDFDIDDYSQSDAGDGYYDHYYDDYNHKVGEGKTKITFMTLYYDGDYPNARDVESAIEDSFETLSNVDSCSADVTADPEAMSLARECSERMGNDSYFGCRVYVTVNWK